MVLILDHGALLPRYCRHTIRRPVTPPTIERADAEEQARVAAERRAAAAESPRSRKPHGLNMTLTGDLHDTYKGQISQLRDELTQARAAEAKQASRDHEPTENQQGRGSASSECFRHARIRAGVLQVVFLGPRRRRCSTGGYIPDCGI
jgi:hypothetical protein